MTKTGDRASRIRQRLTRIPALIDKEVQRMVRLREILPGYVYLSRRRCGKPSCRCARGELHESWVVATKVGGKRTTRSLGGQRRGRIQELTANYRRYRQAQSKLRKLCAEAAELTRALEELIGEDPFKEEGKR